MHIASEKCDIISTPWFCLTLHTVSLYTEESPKSTSRSFPQTLVLQKGYYTSQTILTFTEFYNNLVAKCWEKLWKPRKHSCRFVYSSTVLCNREAERMTPSNKSCWFPEFQHIPRSLLEKRRTVIKHNLWAVAVQLLLKVLDVSFDTEILYYYCC